MSKVNNRKPLQLSYAIRSFVGYLEGTFKSAHTIKSYQSDLGTFSEFLKVGLGSKSVAFHQLTKKDLDAYPDYLKKLGLKTNSRRRKLLTVRKWLKYLQLRGKLTVDMAGQIPAPHKVERVPFTVGWPDLMLAIGKLPESPLLLIRNKVLLQILAETGCTVSELPKLRLEDFSGNSVTLGVKNKRQVPVSSELRRLVHKLAEEAVVTPEDPWLFLGFNKFGSLGAPITPRGIEMLVKGHAKILGFKQLSPRTIRHSRTVHWLKTEKKPISEAQTLLGLKSDYSFRLYAPLLNT
ncbi:tyrosine-type recombinase/integrase [bacterium]|nr:tyrosine-type recombinase/integrase [bacterium]